MSHFSQSPGSIVNIRSRLWRIDSITGEILQATSISGGIGESRRFYLPFESIKNGELPKIDDKTLGIPQYNKLLTRAFRYSMIHGSAPLLSLQKCCVIPTYYQLVPVVMALNMANRVRMLIADDVGLGKTIEAGLITTELMSRNLASRILIICPKNLRDQWQESLRRYFQIDARIISSVHLKNLEKDLPVGASPWSYYKSLITSIDYAKSDRVKPHIFEAKWDLVIVDEAHLAAKPHQMSEKQHVSMDRYDFVKELSKHTNHLLFLTATPHSGYSDSYASLLDMLDCGIVNGPENNPEINRELAKHHVCQRRRVDVNEWFENSGEENPFPKRDQKSLVVEALTEPERKTMDALNEYVSHLLNGVKDEKEQKIIMTARWAVLHLHKRALSSPHALQKSLENRYLRISEMIEKKKDEDDQTGILKPILPLSENQARDIALEGDSFDGDQKGNELTDEEGMSLLDTVAFGSVEALKLECEELSKLRDLAKKITRHNDSKLKKLTATDGYLDMSMRGYFGPKRVIIFTRYRDTLDYLEKAIPESMGKRFENGSIITIYGDLQDAERKERLDKFRKLDKGILIATDCISEGIDLQHMANQIIHYELPWNPNRLEQRNGRVDRYGQDEKTIQIRTLVTDDKLDKAILELLIKKAEQIRADYGFAPPFFGDDVNVFDMLSSMNIEIPEIVHSQRTLDNFTDGKSAELFDPFNERVLNKIKTESFYGQADVDMTSVRQRMKDTEEEIGTVDDLKDFVLLGLQKFGATITENKDAEKTYKFVLSEKQLAPGIRKVYERVTFDPKTAIRGQDIEQINSGHPIVRRLVEQVKEEFFLPNSKFYGRTGVITTPKVSGLTAVYTYLVRFVTKDKASSIIEEIVLCGYDFLEDRILPHDEVIMLDSANPVPNVMSREELLEHLSLALTESISEQVFKQAVTEKMSDIVSERKTLIERMKRDNIDSSWLNGMDQLELVSSDMIAVRLFEAGKECA